MRIYERKKSLEKPPLSYFYFIELAHSGRNKFCPRTSEENVNFCSKIEFFVVRNNI